MISGKISEPHLVEIGDGVVVGEGATVSPHAIAQIGGQRVLIIRRIRIHSDVVIGAGSMISPGSTIGSGAMINALALLPISAEVGKNEMWSGVPASCVRILRS